QAALPGSHAAAGHLRPPQRLPEHRRSGAAAGGRTRHPGAAQRHEQAGSRQHQRPFPTVARPVPYGEHRVAGRIQPSCRGIPGGATSSHSVMNIQKEPFMDSSYLHQYARSADDSTLFEGAALTDKQRELISKVDHYGVAWAERAFKHDREASFPTDNYKDLHEMGFLGLCVPERLGGLGADYRSYMLVASRIAYYCGSTANTFNMHNANSLWTADMVDDMELTDEQRASHERNRSLHYGNMLQGKIYSQPFSEGSGAAAGKHPFGTIARRQ